MADDDDVKPEEWKPPFAPEGLQEGNWKKFAWRVPGFVPQTGWYVEIPAGYFVVYTDDLSTMTFVPKSEWTGRAGSDNGSYNLRFSAGEKK
jgi:hypothetical protein